MKPRWRAGGCAPDFPCKASAFVLVLHVAVEHPTIDGALCRGPDALPLVHDDAPRDEAIAAFSRMFWAYSYSAQTGKDEQVFRIVSL